MIIPIILLYTLNQQVNYSVYISLQNTPESVANKLSYSCRLHYYRYLPGEMWACEFGVAGTASS